MVMSIPGREIRMGDRPPPSKIHKTQQPSRVEFFIVIGEAAKQWHGVYTEVAEEMRC
jgi:hypothetical protein